MGPSRNCVEETKKRMNKKTKVHRKKTDERQGEKQIHLAYFGVFRF